MSFRLDRSRRSDPHLDWKVRIFTVAAVLGLGGIYFDERWMGAAAIALLAAAMLLRFLPKNRDGGGSEGGRSPAERDQSDDPSHRSEG